LAGPADQRRQRAARTAWTGFLTAAREMAQSGTFTRFEHAVPFADINRTIASTSVDGGG